VHRVRVRPESQLARVLPPFAADGWLAMKIQYPGVDKSIDSDLSALKRIFTMAKILPVHGGYDELFKEIRQMLHQEVDYERELEMTREFRELLKDDARFVVPRVVPELSTKRILTTEYLEGVPVDSPEVAALPQERRNALGAAAMELLFMELYTLHQVQTDPHFGNYRVQIGDACAGALRDRLILLDFGAVRKLPKTFLRPYFELHRGVFDRDMGAIERGAKGLGFLSDEDSPEMIRTFCELSYLFSEPYSPRDVEFPAPPELMDTDGVYDWGKSDLPNRVARAAARFALSFKLRPPPREIVFIDRKFGGTFIFLSVLGARIEGRSLLKRYMDHSLTI
ncbi:MAG TPA: AarF/ABC1/UbiB kinase family protein, partial [Bdellovibrionota bacterium]|nr:AarF/ABC1/UbiB kinase family protein [Bdellovibrionota bacterium]